MPHFSIIIPAHNEEDYIQETLNCIKNQTFDDYETIIVANGCTDKTEEVIQQGNYRNTKLYSLPFAHVSRARNYGAGKAEGEVLLFLDADTSLHPTALETMKQEFTPEHSVATTKSKPDDFAMKYRIACGIKNFYTGLGLYKGCSGVLLCSRDLFEKANGYDPEIIVREHRKLTLKLLYFGKYRCIDTYATTSMRRYKYWGLTKGLFFWLKQWFKDKNGKLPESEYEKVR